MALTLPARLPISLAGPHDYGRLIRLPKGIPVPERLIKGAGSQKVAQALLGSGVIRFYDREPFTFTSGLKSPVYVNIRGLLSAPQRDEVIRIWCEGLAALTNHPFDIAVGGETAGIPYAAFVAAQTGKPMAYVRKKTKDFGLKNQIEGGDIAGKRCALIEDLTTDGGSKIAFVEVMREAGALVDLTTSIFYYGIYPETADRLAEHDLSLFYLCDWSDVLKSGGADGYFDADQRDELAAFLSDPQGWKPRAR
jgi:orotate phosphoribosyltransferase